MLVIEPGMVTLFRLAQLRNSWKSMLADARTEDYIGQVRAGVECDGRIGDAGRDDQTGQTARPKRILADIGNAVAENGVGEGLAIIERIGSYVRDAAGDAHRRQTQAIDKGLGANVGHGAADRDRSQAG